MSEIEKGLLALGEQPYLPSGTEAYRMGKITCFVGQEGGRWHMSVAHPKRLPKWEEIKYLRRKLLPEDAFFCLPWPPEEFWLNAHNYCLHLWEIRDRWLIEQMKFEGRSIRRPR